MELNGENSGRCFGSPPQHQLALQCFPSQTELNVAAHDRRSFINYKINNVCPISLFKLY